MYRFYWVITTLLISGPAVNAESVLLDHFCSAWLTSSPQSERWGAIEKALDSKIRAKAKESISPNVRSFPNWDRCVAEFQDTFEYGEFISAGIQFMATTKLERRQPEPASLETQIKVEGMPSITLSSRQADSSSDRVLNQAQIERKDNYERLWSQFLISLQSRVETTVF